VRFKAFRAILTVDTSEAFTQYTGRLTKTLVYSLVRELALIHGMKGLVQPLHISPLFTIGKREEELGEVVTPIYTFTSNGGQKLVPIVIQGEYLLHIGGEGSIIDMIKERFEVLRNPLLLKFENYIVSFKLEKIIDVTGRIMDKDLSSGKVTLYIKAPTLLFNVFVPTKLPKFSPTAVEVLMTPYLLAKMQSMSYSALVEAARILGYMVETYYSLNTLKPIFIPFKSKKEAAMIGRVTYIIEDMDRNRNIILELLRIAEIAGIGESRLNGFGTVTWVSKRIAQAR